MNTTIDHHDMNDIVSARSDSIAISTNGTGSTSSAGDGGTGWWVSR